MEERVTFISAGLELSGIVHVPEGLERGERRPGFLVLHGFGSNKDGGTALIAARMFESLGYVTLRFDMRGCGQSEGERGRVICLEQVDDTRAALAYLLERPEVDPRRIGVFGHSFG